MSDGVVIDSESGEIIDDSMALAELDQAWYALSEVRTPRAALDLSNRAAAVQYYLKRSGAELAVQNKAAAVRLLSEHKAGVLLRDMPKNEGGRPGEKTGNIVLPVSDAPTLADMGISKMQSSRLQVLAELPESEVADYIAETAERGKEITVAGAVKLGGQRKRVRERSEIAQQSVDFVLPSDVSILHADFREVLRDLENDTVDLIFTDPPYDEESIPLYGDVAREASRILKPNGSLIIYAGHYALPQIFSLMCPYLRFWWTIALKHQGGSARLPGKWVFVQWKPLLWFVKGGRRDTRYVADLFESTVPDKSLHDWQQDESEAAYYISQLTDPGDLVVDPFCGSGTTCAAAVSLRRRTVGVDHDESAVSVARARIYQTGRSESS